MNTDNELDDLLRQKLAQREIPFEQAHWEAAESLIEAARRRRRRRWFFLPLFLTEVVAACGLLYWAGLELGSADGSPAAREWATSVMEICPDTETAVSQWQAGSDSDQPQAPDSPRQKRTSRGNHSAQAGPKPQREISRRANTAVPAAMSQTTVTGSEDSLTRRILTEEIYRQIASTRVSLRETFPVHTLPVRAYVWGPLSATHPEAGAVGAETRRHYLGLVISPGLAPVWNPSEGIAPVGTTVAAGLRYAVQVTPRLRFSTGLLYSSRAGLNLDTTYTGTSFGFGFETRSFTVSPQRLHQLEVPLMAELRVYNRHYAIAGISVARLLDVSAQVREQRETSFGVQPQGYRTAWGYRQGFRTWDPGMTVGYAYYLGRGLRVGMLTRIGLQDIADPAYHQRATQTPNTQFRLLLEYDLIHF